MPEPVPPQFAEDIPVKKGHSAYALPYYTRADGDTELLLSNPGPAGVSGTAYVIGRKCTIVAKKRIKLGPDCTQSIRLRAIEPDNAGHVVVVASAPILAHVVYVRRGDLAIVGDSMTGVKETIGWLPGESSRTYAFGYRSLPLRDAFGGGSVFVSNPNASTMLVKVLFFHEKCELAEKDGSKIRAGCTAEFPFPRGHFGYGRIQVSAPAVMNVLHFADEEGSIAAAELLAEGDRIDTGIPERERKGRVLIDHTHQCRPSSGDWSQYEATLSGAGYTVTQLSGTLDLATLEQHDVFVVSMARDVYTPAELSAMQTFVNNGGGLLVCQDFGNQPPIPLPPWVIPTRGVLNAFGATDDNNAAQDVLHNLAGQPTHLVLETGRNFGSHPIVQPLKRWTTGTPCTLSGAGWDTVTETDADAAPPNRPLLIARAHGSGRVVAIGDSNTFADHLAGEPQNQELGVRCVSWLLFEI